MRKLFALILGLLVLLISLAAAADQPQAEKTNSGAEDDNGPPEEQTKARKFAGVTFQTNGRPRAALPSLKMSRQGALKF